MSRCSEARPVISVFVVIGLFVFVLGGCQRRPPEEVAPPDPTPGEERWESIECVTEVESVDVHLGEPTQVSLKALATGGSDGAAVDVTSEGWWTVLAGEGTVDDGVFTTPGDRGGLAVIGVQLDGLSATCTIAMHLRVWIDDAGTGLPVDDVLAQPLELNDACAAVVVYPQRQATFPPNQYPPEFQWLPGWETGVHLVALESQYVHVLVSTISEVWEPDFPLLKMLSRSHDGARTPFDLRVLSAAFNYLDHAFESHLCTSNRSMEMTVSEVVLAGSVIYWSPITEGLWSIEVGATDARPILEREQTGGCVGCHTVNVGSADRMSMTWGDWAVVSEIGDLPNPIVGPDVLRPAQFTALDGRGDFQVRAWEGVLFLDDIVSGESLGALPTEGYATHPSMNAEGDRLIYTSCWGSVEGDLGLFGCGLRMLETDEAGTLARDSVLVETSPIWNYYYPSVSPDGRWVVFNRSTGDTESDVDAELMLLPLSGALDPIRLDRANGSLNVKNSWPRWGAMVGQRAWLSFSSSRGYGWFGGGGVPQVWLAELDLALANSGFDPSSSAIRLPGQDIETGNHTPVWVPRGAGL